MESRSSATGLLRWFGLSGDGTREESEENTSVPLASALSPAQKILISVLWAAVCGVLFFLFTQLNIMVAAAFLAVSLFTQGLAVIAQVTLRR